MKRKFKVLYTHQKVKKQKVWQDGMLHLCVDEKRGYLFNENSKELGTVYLNKKQVINGLELENDKYLIQVEDEMGNNENSQCISIKNSHATPEETNSNISVKKSKFSVPRRVETPTTAYNTEEESNEKFPSVIKAQAKSIWSSVVDDSCSLQKHVDLAIEREPPGSISTTKSEVRGTSQILQLLGGDATAKQPDDTANKSQPATLMSTVRNFDVEFPSFLDEISSKSETKSDVKTVSVSKCLKLGPVGNLVEDKQATASAGNLSSNDIVVSMCRESPSIEHIVWDCLEHVISLVTRDSLQLPHKYLTESMSGSLEQTVDLLPQPLEGIATPSVENPTTSVADDCELSEMSVEDGSVEVIRDGLVVDHVDEDSKYGSNLLLNVAQVQVEEHDRSDRNSVLLKRDTKETGMIESGKAEGEIEVKTLEISNDVVKQTTTDEDDLHRSCGEITGKCGFNQLLLHDDITRLSPQLLLNEFCSCEEIYPCSVALELECSHRTRSNPPRADSVDIDRSSRCETNDNEVLTNDLSSLDFFTLTSLSSATFPNPIHSNLKRTSSFGFSSLNNVNEQESDILGEINSEPVSEYKRVSNTGTVKEGARNVEESICRSSDEKKVGFSSNISVTSDQHKPSMKEEAKLMGCDSSVTKQMTEEDGISEAVDEGQQVHDESHEMSLDGSLKSGGLFYNAQSTLSTGNRDNVDKESISYSPLSNSQLSNEDDVSTFNTNADDVSTFNTAKLGEIVSSGDNEDKASTKRNNVSDQEVPNLFEDHNGSQLSEELLLEACKKLEDKFTTFQSNSNELENLLLCVDSDLGPEKASDCIEHRVLNSDTIVCNNSLYPDTSVNMLSPKDWLGAHQYVTPSCGDVNRTQSAIPNCLRNCAGVSNELSVRKDWEKSCSSASARSDPSVPTAVKVKTSEEVSSQRIPCVLDFMTFPKQVSNHCPAVDDVLNVGNYSIGGLNRPIVASPLPQGTHLTSNQYCADENGSNSLMELESITKLGGVLSKKVMSNHRGCLYPSVAGLPMRNESYQYLGRNIQGELSPLRAQPQKSPHLFPSFQSKTNDFLRRRLDHEISSVSTEPHEWSQRFHPDLTQSQRFLPTADESSSLCPSAREVPLLSHETPSTSMFHVFSSMDSFAVPGNEPCISSKDNSFDHFYDVTATPQLHSRNDLKNGEAPLSRPPSKWDRFEGDDLYVPACKRMRRRWLENMVDLEQTNPRLCPLREPNMLATPKVNPHFSRNENILWSPM